jgi:hypothetical protein
MNDIAKQRICDRLIKALADEDITTADAGRALGINHDHYVSMIKNPKLWNKAPKSAWESALHWANSGQTIRGYSAAHSRVLPKKDEAMPKDKEQDTFAPDLEISDLSKPVRIQRIINEPAATQKIGIDIEINLIINGKKISL